MVGARFADGPKFVEAERFVVRDSQGRERASLYVRADGTPTLEFRDEEGECRACLELHKDGSPYLGFRDQDGTSQLLLSANREGAALLIPGRQDLAGIHLGAQPAGSILSLGGGAGKPGVLLGTSGDGETSISLSPADRRIRMGLRVDRDGIPSVTLYDAEKNGRFVLAPKDGAPGMVFFDERKRLRMSLTADQDGTPQLRLMDSFGATLFEAPAILPDRLPPK